MGVRRRTSEARSPERAVVHVDDIAVNTDRKPRSVYVLTPWRTKCGIAKQSEYLVPHLDSLGLTVRVLSNGSPSERVTACWSDPFGAASVRETFQVMASGDASVLHVQYEPGIFRDELAHLLANARSRIHLKVILDAHFVDAKVRSLYDGVVDRYVVHSEHLRFDRATVVPLASPEPCVLTKAEARAKLGLLNYARLVGFFGFLSPNKGLADLFPVVERARAVTGLSVGLVVVGSSHPKTDGKYEAELKSRSPSWCTWVGGFREDADALQALAACDVVVLPYRNDSHSSSAASKFALASGRGLVVSRSNMFADLEAAVRVDSQTMADEVASLLRDEASIEKLATNCRAECSARFTPEVVGRRYAALYQELTG